MNRAEEIAHNLQVIQEEISKVADSVGRSLDEITLIAVTKNFPASDAQILYELGIRNMGENRDEEGALKSEELPSDIFWHFQGQIQSRKIKSIASWADNVHSLDSFSHAEKFRVVLADKPMKFFIQVNLEPEREDRGGVAPDQVEPFLEKLLALGEIKPVGLMTVAPIDQDPRAAFEMVRTLKERLQQIYPTITELSMGMSGDYKEAIYAGATHIRIGSSILGSRGYPA